MSVDSIKPANYVKFIWPVKFLTVANELYSDQFKIDNLENVVFSIGLKFNVPSNTSICLWVKKSNSEIAHATINISFGNTKSTVEVLDWKDYCHFESIKLTGETVTRRFTGDWHENNHFHETNITCEIFWKSIIKNPPHNNLFDEMKIFYNSQDFSDVTLVVGKVKIPSHKVILSAHSPVFSRMLQSEMRESKENIINIKDVDAEIILEMLHYFYKGETKASHDSEIALKILEVADMYQITKLKDICEGTLLSNMTVDNVLYILGAADDHNAVDLRSSAMKFIVCNSKKVFAISKFKEFFYENKKPDLMFELMRAVGDK
ncbi:uncharacterized protein LOC130664753 [Microplitis mediator]|uniref:uncharacterized protein LOC130664753 n=1 Tax=Microplitis mediator TaxID=375433 RepID=UPI002555956C|nr:uncharacterized protein LOC130664753 [Microplitis mediator]XP_057320818.1 uncharacterized protein LOC130664753 [Microplitis mediator]XP_057320819.1 uncharacterized protein LOC130664753 [Microplitis mediator]